MDKVVTLQEAVTRIKEGAVIMIGGFGFQMISIVGILAGLVILVVLIYKKCNILVTSLTAATVVLLFSRLPFIESLGVWSEGFAGYVKNNFLLFAFSALFGKLMEDSGAASAFAQMIYKVLERRELLWAASWRHPFWGMQVSHPS